MTMMVTTDEGQQARVLLCQKSKSSSVPIFVHTYLLEYSPKIWLYYSFVPFLQESLFFFGLHLILFKGLRQPTPLTHQVVLVVARCHQRKNSVCLSKASKRSIVGCVFNVIVVVIVPVKS